MVVHTSWAWLQPPFLGGQSHAQLSTHCVYVTSYGSSFFFFFLQKLEDELGPEAVQEMLRNTEKRNAEKMETIMKIAKSKDPPWVSVKSPPKS